MAGRLVMLGRRGGINEMVAAQVFANEKSVRAREVATDDSVALGAA
jgi:hypothetical protein